MIFVDFNHLVPNSKANLTLFSEQCGVSVLGVISFISST